MDLIRNNASSSQKWQRKLTLHQATRFVPPSAIHPEGWAVENLVGPRRWKIGVPGILLLLSCVEPKTRRESILEVGNLTGLPESELDKLMSLLEVAALIVPQEDLQTEECARRRPSVSETWREKGWPEAAEYHMATYAYPFPDYSCDGRAIDTARMQSYISSQADDNRSKSLPPDKGRIPLPEPEAELMSAPLSIQRGDVDVREVSRESILSIISLSLGEIGLIKGGRWARAPMLRKTSPSGGGRHPTEAYLLVLDVPGIAPGWYYIGVRPAVLCLLREEVVPKAELQKVFPLGFARAPMNVRCLVILTSMFERNMYRYREPRTFRTVHMDAGHIATNIVLCAEAKGLATHVAYSDNDLLIEERIGLDGLEEGYMLTVSIGNPFPSGGVRNTGDVS